eukprot:jgi/Chlat1/5924/Chrsp4S06412
MSEKLAEDHTAQVLVTISIPLLFMSVPYVLDNPSTALWVAGALAIPGVRKALNPIARRMWKVFTRRLQRAWGGQTTRQQQQEGSRRGVGRAERPGRQRQRVRGLLPPPRGRGAMGYDDVGYEDEGGEEEYEDMHDVGYMRRREENEPAPLVRRQPSSLFLKLLTWLFPFLRSWGGYL